MQAAGITGTVPALGREKAASCLAQTIGHFIEGGFATRGNLKIPRLEPAKSQLDKAGVIQRYLCSIPKHFHSGEKKQNKTKRKTSIPSRTGDLGVMPQGMTEGAGWRKQR